MKSQVDTEPVERRRWARLPLAMPVFLRGTDRQGTRFLEFSTALNVSAGGMLVAVRRSLRLREAFTIEIPAVPQPGNPRIPGSIRLIKGVVVREMACDRGHLIAFRFLRPLI